MPAASVLLLTRNATLRWPWGLAAHDAPRSARIWLIGAAEASYERARLVVEPVAQLAWGYVAQLASFAKRALTIYP